SPGRGHGAQALPDDRLLPGGVATGTGVLTRLRTRSAHVAHRTEARPGHERVSASPVGGTVVARDCARPRRRRTAAEQGEPAPQLVERLPVPDPRSASSATTTASTP